MPNKKVDEYIQGIVRSTEPVHVACPEDWSALDISYFFAAITALPRGAILDKIKSLKISGAHRNLQRIRIPMLLAQLPIDIDLTDNPYLQAPVQPKGASARLLLDDAIQQTGKPKQFPPEILKSLAATGCIVINDDNGYTSRLETLTHSKFIDTIKSKNTDALKNILKEIQEVLDALSALLKNSRLNNNQAMIDAIAYIMNYTNDNHDITFLTHVAFLGNYDAVFRYVKLGADVNLAMRSPNDVSILHLAINNGASAKVITYMLSIKGIDVNAMCQMKAIRDGEAVGDVIDECGFLDLTPLQIAIYKRRPDIVAQLLEHGAYANPMCFYATARDHNRPVGGKQVSTAIESLMRRDPENIELIGQILQNCTFSSLFIQELLCKIVSAENWKLFNHLCFKCEIPINMDILHMLIDLRNWSLIKELRQRYQEESCSDIISPEFGLENGAIIAALLQFDDDIINAIIESPRSSFNDTNEGDNESRLHGCITHELILFPVTMSDGNVYDRKEMISFMKMNHNKPKISPLTGELLVSHKIPDITRNMVGEIVEYIKTVGNNMLAKKKRPTTT